MFFQLHIHRAVSCRYIRYTRIIYNWHSKTWTSKIKLVCAQIKTTFINIVEQRDYWNEFQTQPSISQLNNFKTFDSDINHLWYSFSQRSTHTHNILQYSFNLHSKFNLKGQIHIGRKIHSLLETDTINL